MTTGPIKLFFLSIHKTQPSFDVRSMAKDLSFGRKMTNVLVNYCKLAQKADGMIVRPVDLI
ncbi:hypothetical protein GCM10008940_11240 [Microbulbifer agarilyticus]